MARQEKACRDLAERLGWSVDVVRKDNSVSASSGLRRPGFEALLLDVSIGTVDAVLAWHPDRMARRPDDLERLITVVEKRRAKVATVEAGEYDLSTPSGRATARTVIAWARAEVEHKGSRQKASNRQAAEAGKVGWTRRPFGYDRVNGEVVVVEDEAEALRDAATRVRAGESLASIVRTLTDRGVRTSTGAEFSVTTLRRLLLNPRMSGEAFYIGERVAAGTWQPILDTDTQSAVAAVLRDPRRRVQTSTTRRYPLSGAIRCGICGGDARVYATTADGRRERYVAYRCRKPHLTRRLDLVDEVVVRVLLARLERPDAADLFSAATDVAATQREIAELRTRLDDLAALLADGVLTREAVREQGTKLRTRREGLQRELEAATADSPAASLLSAKDIKAAWELLSVNHKRAVVDELLTVTLLPAGRGARFDPELVQIEWKTTS